MKIGKFSIVLIIFLIFFQCLVEETIKDKDAYEDLYISILYKSSQCSSNPKYFLILPKKIEKRWYYSCLFAIIRSECPFLEYPPLCFKIYE